MGRMRAGERHVVYMGPPLRRKQGSSGEPALGAGTRGCCGPGRAWLVPARWVSGTWNAGQLQ